MDEEGGMIEMKIQHREIENPMVVDRYWNDEPHVVGECAGCGENIYAGEDIYDYEGELELILVHQNTECCEQFVSDRSRCKVAGE